VLIDHGNGEFSMLAHLQHGSVSVKKGDKVTRGQPIAKIGSSGSSNNPHLHFELRNGIDFKSDGLPAIFPSPGNHEYGTPKAAGYFDYFGAAAGPDRRGYYRYLLGSWQVYSLNSYLEPAQHAIQLAWLKQELATHPSACAMAHWHHPLFSSGKYASLRMRDTWDILYDANVDLIVAGHDHIYERFVPQTGAGKRDAARGITQFVVGTGGAELLQLNELLPNSAAVQTMQFGVLKLNLHAGGFSWRFLPINASVVQDSGQQACH
jgi:hypothetical protein